MTDRYSKSTPTESLLYIEELCWLGTSSAVYPSCPTPKVTTMSPKTWFAGKSYPVTITGTGFTTSANATASCPVTPVAAKVASGSSASLTNCDSRQPNAGHIHRRAGGQRSDWKCRDHCGKQFKRWRVFGENADSRQSNPVEWQDNQYS